MKVDPGLDIGAIGQSIRFLDLFQLLRAFIAPPVLGDEGIPELNGLAVGTTESLETPFENLLIRSACPGPVDYLLRIQIEEATETRTKTILVCAAGNIVSGGSNP